MEITRKSHVADAILLEFAGKVIEFLPFDFKNFKDFDPDLNEDKLNLLKATYVSALTFGTDINQLGELKKLTENLSAEFKNCITIFRKVRYFVLKKFRTSPAVLTQFGFDNYRKATKSQPDMVVFMHELAKTAEKYKSELLAAGLKEPVISSIKMAAASLEKTNISQETGKNNRSGKTEERINLLNDLYVLMSDFSDAAKIIFANDPLKRERYILPYPKSVEKDSDNLKK